MSETRRTAARYFDGYWLQGDSVRRNFYEKPRIDEVNCITKFDLPVIWIISFNPVSFLSSFFDRQISYQLKDDQALLLIELEK